MNIESTQIFFEFRISGVPLIRDQQGRSNKERVLLVVVEKWQECPQLVEAGICQEAHLIPVGEMPGGRHFENARGLFQNCSVLDVLGGKWGLDGEIVRS